MIVAARATMGPPRTLHRIIVVGTAHARGLWRHGYGLGCPRDRCHPTPPLLNWLARPCKRKPPSLRAIHVGSNSLRTAPLSRDRAPQARIGGQIFPPAELAAIRETPKGISTIIARQGGRFGAQRDPRPASSPCYWALPISLSGAIGRASSRWSKAPGIAICGRDVKRPRAPFVKRQARIRAASPQIEHCSSFYGAHTKGAPPRMD